MSVAEIKASIDGMTTDERFFAAAYLHHLAQANDPAYQNALAERMNRMESGRKLGAEQVARIHQTLENEGV